MDCNLVVDIHCLLEGPELETLTLNQEITKFGGKGGKFRLISDLDDKTNFVFSRNRQKKIWPLHRGQGSSIRMRH